MYSETFVKIHIMEQPDLTIALPYPPVVSVNGHLYYSVPSQIDLNCTNTFLAISVVDYT